MAPAMASRVMGTVPAGAFTRNRSFQETGNSKQVCLGKPCFRKRVSSGLGPGALEIAFAKIIRDLVQRALFPLFGFSEPENPAFGIERRALSAEKFLPADFNELVHELHSSVKPINL
jgi:hypothetical protein